jgi:hypothetical protein
MTEVLEEPVVMAVHKLCKDKGHSTVRSTEWLESDRLLIFRGKIYVPKDRKLGVALWSNIMICALLDMQAALRHLSSYCTTIGGPRYTDTLESMSKHATYAIGISCDTIDSMESFTLQRL